MADSGAESGQVTALLFAWRAGNQTALEQLIPLVYEELHQLAGRYMRREKGSHTLQATALVNEAYLRLAKEQDRTWENRTHFFAVAAQIMRNLLVDHARAAQRVKRGGGAAQAMLEESSAVISADPDEVLALDEALQTLAKVDPRAARIVELRYFVGLSNSEAADVLQISEKTAKRDWSAAKAWLEAELRSRQ